MIFLRHYATLSTNVRGVSRRSLVRLSETLMVDFRLATVGCGRIVVRMFVILMRLEFRSVAGPAKPSVS
jgi:hypothetical protein